MGPPSGKRQIKIEKLKKLEQYPWNPFKDHLEEQPKTTKNTIQTMRIKHQLFQKTPDQITKKNSSNDHSSMRMTAIGISVPWLSVRDEYVDLVERHCYHGLFCWIALVFVQVSQAQRNA